MATRQQTSLRTFIKKHPVLTFYILVFPLGWGPATLILAAFPGTAGATATSPAGLSLFTYLARVSGLLSPALTGILVIALAFGRVGLRDLRSRLFRWRVGVRWYAVALLTAPLLWTAILFTLSLTSTAFLPAIITAGDKASLLVAGLVVGLVTSFFEELGWTGFATPEIRKRHGLLATGLIVGLLWFVYHLPLLAAADSGAVPKAVAVAAVCFWVLPYRVLMVWVYDHTQSVLMAVLMHLSIDLSAFLLLPPLVGVPDLIFNLVAAATLWVLVAAVAAASRRKHSRPESDGPGTAAKYSSTHAA
jgi:CAAX protease family protein